MENKEKEKNEKELIAEAITDGLLRDGFIYVYILPSTGRYKGEKHLTDFPVGYRTGCFYLIQDRNEDFIGKTKDDLINTMIECLEKGIPLEDARNQKS